MTPDDKITMRDETLFSK